VFDFVGMFYGEREFDLATFYVNSLCDDEYLWEAINTYTYGKNISYKKIYRYALERLIQNYKKGQPIREEGIK